MNASEARQLVKAATIDMEAKHQVQYEDIMDKIRAEIKASVSYEMWYFPDIPAPLKKRLEEDGYKVTSHSERNESYYKISWANTSEGIQLKHS